MNGASWGCCVIAKKKQKSTPYVAIASLVLVVVVVLIVVFAGNSKDYGSFATCLAEKGYAMGGTEWCPHCKEQKSYFKGAFEDVFIPAGGYHDCDRQRQWCEDHNITGYPTWITPEGNQLVGTQQLSTLARISGCGL